MQDVGDVAPVTPDTHHTYEQILDKAFQVHSALADQTASTCRKGDIPLVLGGDHSLGMGSISGALRAYGGDLGVLWIDAHMDMNTPETSPSGNLHGMPVAALCRLDAGKPQSPAHDCLVPFWKKALAEIVPDPGLDPTKMAWLGLRDVDSGEVANYKKQPSGVAITMQDIDHDGVIASMDRIDAWIHHTGIKKLWISFDVDSLDPIFAPGTGTKVRGGLTYREGHLIAELLHIILHREGSHVSLAGADIVEVNPMADNRGETANIAIEWALSLFGQTIMGGLRL